MDIKKQAVDKILIMNYKSKKLRKKVNKRAFARYRAKNKWNHRGEWIRGKYII